MIWDVRKLIHASQGLPTRNVPLSDIAELDENWWFFEGEGIPTVRAIIGHVRLMNEADLSYPVLLCAEGRLMDGMHRVARALSEGHDTIFARQFDVTPPHDFVDVPLDELPYD